MQQHSIYFGTPGKIKGLALPGKNVTVTVSTVYCLVPLMNDPAKFKPWYIRRQLEKPARHSAISSGDRAVFIFPLRIKKILNPSCKTGQKRCAF